MAAAAPRMGKVAVQGAYGHEAPAICPWANPPCFQPITAPSGSRHPPQRFAPLWRPTMPAFKMTPQDQQRLCRGAAHLHRLGPRAVSDMLATLDARIGGGPALLAVLAEFEQLLPGQVRAADNGRSSPSRTGTSLNLAKLVSEDTDQASHTKHDQPPSGQ